MPLRQAHELSIPYPTECVADVIRQGRHKIDLPPSASFFLKGLPKTGTTWTEVITHAAASVLVLCTRNGLTGTAEEAAAAPEPVIPRNPRR